MPRNDILRDTAEVNKQPRDLFQCMCTHIWVIISQVGRNVRNGLKVRRHCLNEVWVFLESIINLTGHSTHPHDQIEKVLKVLHVLDIFKVCVHHGDLSLHQSVVTYRIFQVPFTLLSLSMTTSTRPLLGSSSNLRALLGNLGPLRLLPEGHRVLFPLPLRVDMRRN